MFTHFPKDPNFDGCQLTKTTHARCKNRSLKRTEEISPLTSFGDFLITAQNIESRRRVREMTTGPPSSCKRDIRIRYRMGSTNMRRKQHPSCGDSCSIPEDRNSLQTIQGSLFKSCQDVQWTHDTKTPCLSEDDKKGRNSSSDGSKCPTRTLVGLCDGLLLLRNGHDKMARLVVLDGS